jgi:predicted nucleic acid-binding protein
MSIRYRCADKLACKGRQPLESTDGSYDVIDDLIINMSSNFNISVPSSAALLKANKLQSSDHFDPFDAILLALAEIINIDVLVTRDKEFRELGQKYILIRDPEETLAMVMDEEESISEGRNSGSY